MKIYLFIILFSFPTLAQKIKVIYAKGHVQTMRYGTAYDISRGDRLRRKETLVTGDKSLCILKIENHTTIKLEENSKLDLSATKRSRGVSKTNLIMKVGEMVINVVKNTKNLETNVQTGLASFGIRGTTFKASAHQDKEWLAVKEGIVEASSFKNQVDFVQQGEAIFIEKEIGFTKPLKYKFVEKINWRTDIKKNVKVAFNELSEVFGINKEIDEEYKKKKLDWFISPQRAQQLKELKARWSAGWEKAEKASESFRDLMRSWKKALRGDEEN
jgi:hypothetical protein